MSIAKIGQRAPEFSLECVLAADSQPRLVSPDRYSGQWLILIFYPRDFSFVCPTELTAFSARAADFRERGCELLGISVDTIELHQEWLGTPPEAGGLGPLQFPLASDSQGAAARSFGVWIEDRAVSTRGLFIIDPEGVLQYAVVHNLSVGRSPEEVLRVLDALRTGGLCPASWTSADGTVDPERALQPGRILGHYRIRGKLGGGTFGTVFAAWDLRLERMVALKVLKRNVFESREAALAEARAAAKVNHPHVCTIYAVEEIDGLPVIVMEYLDGRPLSEVIAVGIDRERAMRLADEVAAGLAAAHRQDVVHGDLKPANVIVTSDDVVRILDFGLARSRQHASDSGEVSNGPADERDPSMPPLPDTDGDATIVWSPAESTGDSGGRSSIQGTPAYMSPEHATGRPLTPASDAFSFGLMLFELLTGRRANSEGPPLAWLHRLQDEDLARDLTCQVDEPYRATLAALLARDPDARPSLDGFRFQAD